VALDSAAKRQAVSGAARPWMRGQFPSAGKGREWRSSVGLTYPVANFQAVDTAPDAFTFTDVTGQELGALITSNTITISGITSTAPVNFIETGHLSGEFSINGAAFADLVTTTIENTDTLQLRLTSAVLQNEVHSIKVTIGGVTDTWDVTTLEEWTDQADSSTTWTDESNESTTWTDQSNESTTWTDDP